MCACVLYRLRKCTTLFCVCYAVELRYMYSARQILNTHTRCRGDEHSLHSTAQKQHSTFGVQKLNPGLVEFGFAYTYMYVSVRVGYGVCLRFACTFRNQLFCFCLEMRCMRIQVRG